MNEHVTQEPKKEISQEDTSKIQWMMQLFGFVKTLMKRIKSSELIFFSKIVSLN